jgi:acetolactate synthase-1/2/3 large subunit
MMELATAAERKLGVTWIVLNNQALGWVQYNQVLMQKPFVGTQFGVRTDFAKIAEAQGCAGVRVSEAKEVTPALQAALEANRTGMPCLVDIAIEKHDYLPHFVAIHKARVEH